MLKSVEQHYTFTADAAGTYTVNLLVRNADGVAGKASELTIVVNGPYKEGTYFLLEGNMSNDNGNICFVDANGTFYANPYGEANQKDGKPTSPGNVLQDMFIYKDNAYFITQNGAANGQGARLVIADAQTLKAKSLVTGSIDDASVWPQHIVVIDENKAYIRYSTSDYESRSGIRVMNLSTGVWNEQDIEGTAGAFTVSGSTKARMLLLGDKVYAPCGQYLQVIDTKTDKVVNILDFGSYAADQGHRQRSRRQGLSVGFGDVYGQLLFAGLYLFGDGGVRGSLQLRLYRDGTSGRISDAGGYLVAQCGNVRVVYRARAVFPHGFGIFHHAGGPVRLQKRYGYQVAGHSGRKRPGNVRVRLSGRGSKQCIVRGDNRLHPFDDRYLRCQNGCSPGKYLHHLVRISGGDRLHVPFLGLVDAAMRPKDERSIRGAS